MAEFEYENTVISSYCQYTGGGDQREVLYYVVNPVNDANARLETKT